MANMLHIRLSWRNSLNNKYYLHTAWTQEQIDTVSDNTYAVSVACEILRNDARGTQM